MAQKITKAVIAAAGLGTRFLPMTKAMPKEMLPIIDKPIIQYVVEEAVAAGITDIIIVGSSTKRPIEDHFDHQYELERKLRADGKAEMAERMERIADMANFVYIRQKGTYGNGTPIVNAAHLIDQEPFLVLWADDFFLSKTPRSVSLVQAYEKVGKSVLSLIPVERERIKNYGHPKIRSKLSDGLFELDNMVEKPGPDQINEFEGKTYASVGGYILTPDIIPILARQQPNTNLGGEIFLPDAINQLIQEQQVYGQVIDGRWHDAGNKEKYLEAIVDVALADETISPAFRAYLEAKLQDK